MAIRYLISAEASRPGRQDYWHGVYLTGKPPLASTCLEITKILFLYTFSIFTVMTPALLQDSVFSKRHGRNTKDK